MKELTIKEKAKAYDEVVNKLKGFMAQGVDPLITRADVQDFFPELKESEDERIRKKLIEAVKGDMVVGGTKDKQLAIAWLEKQGTPAKLSEEEQNRFAKGVLTSCALSFINYLDAHKRENKMCVSNGECEDIENAFHNAMWDKLHRYYGKYIEKQGEKPQCKSALEAAKEEKVDNTEKKEPKKIEQKPWSEEDEERIKNILSVLDVQVCWDGATGEKKNPYQKEIDWLKSLRPQNRWKPSEEQIEALDFAADCIVPAEFCIKRKVLKELLEQLKKLREE